MLVEILYVTNLNTDFLNNEERLEISTSPLFETPKQVEKHTYTRSDKVPKIQLN